MEKPEKLSLTIAAAKSYESVEDLWVITSFYNSQNYQTRYANYLMFIDSLEKSHINYLVVECAFNDQEFKLQSSSKIIQFRSKSILWQKERLLNLAMSYLPSNCTKIAWIDCDVLFENPLWAAETSKLLENHVVVQPFDLAIRLPRYASVYQGEGDYWESFAAVQQNKDSQIPVGDFSVHGHSGFAWAIRRDVISKHGFYDRCLSGSSDHLMMHAFCGDYFSNCIYQMLGTNEHTLKHFREWARSIYPDVLGNIGCVPGALLHLWHGDLANKQYLKRNQELAELNYNPYTDVFINAAGCLEWTVDDPRKNELHEWAVNFHASRKEDG